jgi:hypothetical protein
MTRLLGAVLAAGLLMMSPAVSQESGAGNRGTSLKESEMQRDGIGTSAVSTENMEVHRKQMSEMQALMDRARATTDPEEWTRLMMQHSEMMQEQAAMMMGDGHAEMVQHCNDRMAMMQDLAEQMTLHHGLQRPDTNE